MKKLFPLICLLGISASAETLNVKPDRYYETFAAHAPAARLRLQTELAFRGGEHVSDSKQIRGIPVREQPTKDRKIKTERPSATAAKSGGLLGLYVHSLGEIPTGAERAYYVYLLDYGWEEPLGSAVRANLPPHAFGRGPGVSQIPLLACGA